MFEEGVNLAIRLRRRVVGRAIRHGHAVGEARNRLTATAEFNAIQRAGVSSAPPETRNGRGAIRAWSS